MTVAVFASPGTRTATGSDAVLASLPLSYSIADRVSGSVAVVEGGSAWPLTASDALEAGAIGVLVVHPEPADVHPLLRRGGLVVLDSPWASSSVVPLAAVALRAALLEGGRLECRLHLGTGSSGEAALLDQLSLVRALLGAPTELTLLTSSDSGYAAEAQAGGHPVDLSMTCSDAVPESIAVRLLTDGGSVDLRIPSSATAEPAQLTTLSSAGALQHPTRYESGHRTTWRRLGSVLARRSPTTDLTDFASDRTIVRSAFEQAEG